MRTHLEFNSAQFCEPEPPEDRFHFHVFGINLAEFLAEQFRALGYDGTITGEDWGWAVQLASDPFDLWLGCSGYADADGWLIQIKPNKPFLRRWFRKVDTQPVVEGIADELERILVNNGGATDLNWWSDEESGRK